jgi:peroxiredoxin
MVKFSTLTKLGAATLLSAAVGLANAGERVSDFSLVDAEGRFFQLSRHANQDAVVLFTQDESRDMRKAAKDIAALAEQFAGQKVEFLMLDSTGRADKAELRKAAEKAGISLRVLIDDTQLVAEELGLSRALEVAILDPAAKELVYRGALNDRFAEGKKARRASEHYVADALQAMMAGEEVTAQFASNGDAIDFAFGRTHERLLRE